MQWKRSGHFNGNISRSAEALRAALGCIDGFALPSWRRFVFRGHELTHRKLSAQSQHQEPAARYLTNKNRILAKGNRMQYQGYCSTVVARARKVA
jgi:hypothetical protein